VNRAGPVWPSERAPGSGRRWLIWPATACLLAAMLSAALAACSQRESAHQISGARLELDPAVEAPAFERALAPRQFTFPADHGPHDSYQTEWWYYTGNLQDSAGDRFGFQLTFFRRALGRRPAGAVEASVNLYFAHFALTDIAAREHIHFERFAREDLGLAGGSGDPFHVWLEDWSVAAMDPAGGRVRLKAQQGEYALELELQALKPVVAHGQAGWSPKGEDPGRASYYLSFTRMAARGELLLNGRPAAVSGQAWFDHEWSTSALPPQAIGWDWFSLQMSDGRELMLFRIRREDGSVEPASAGTIIEVDGRAAAIDWTEIELDVLDSWTSPTTGAVYPASWRLVVPSAGVDLFIEPWVADQEMRLSFVYWEGAVRASGESAGQPVDGVGYVELTGYAASMQGAL
jgi:predicted secreted hydrolase